MSPPFPSWRPKFASWLPPRTFPKTFAPQSWRFCTNWIRSNRSSTWPQMTMSKCRCIIPKLRRFIVVLPPMMKTMKPSPRRIRLSRLIVKSGVAILLCGVTVTAQSRIIRPQTQPTARASARRQHTATLRASDSPDGSRVALSSDQSLNDYEAYRRGDRFYVKIPAADVPRAEAVRGRGFADVKTQRSGDGTLISFRLPPGASARVEQHGNHLEVLFTVAGASSAIASNAGQRSAGAESNRNSSGNKRSSSPLLPKKSAESSRNSNANKRAVLPVAAKKGAQLSRNSNTNKRAAAPANANKNSADRSTSSIAQSARDSNLTSKSAAPLALPSSEPIATPLPSPVSSPNAKPTQTPAQRLSATASPTSQPTPLPVTN